MRDSAFEGRNRDDDNDDDDGFFRRYVSDFRFIALLNLLKSKFFSFEGYIDTHVTLIEWYIYRVSALMKK